MKEKTPQTNKKRRAALVAAALVLLLTPLFIDSSLRLVNTKYELFYDNLPESFDGFRIVQLSDLHMASYGKDNEKLIYLVKAEEPDLIALTGDFLNSWSSADRQVERLRPFLEKLAEIAPCYFVSGNHEWASGGMPEFAGLLEELGIKYLRNEFIVLERDGDQLLLAGAEDPNGPADMLLPSELAGLMGSSYPEHFSILLAHRNYWLEKYPRLPVDLILCGHAHGGMVRLPFIGGVFGTELDLFPEYDTGVYNRGGYNLVVSRGLGGFYPVPRLFNNPELVTVILRK